MKIILDLNIQKLDHLKKELHKVYRSIIIVNPKWVSGMQDHGYKGAFETATTMDYLFACDATTNLIEDFIVLRHY